jgi:flagellar biosynthesis protein FliQ
MTPGELTAVMQRALMVTLNVGGPIVVATLVIGLVVSIVQAATQINEATLTFVPKLLIVAAVLWLLGPGMLQSLIDFTRSIFVATAGVGK